MTKFPRLSRPRTAYFGLLLACLITGITIITASGSPNQSALISGQKTKPASVTQSVNKPATGDPTTVAPVTPTTTTSTSPTTAKSTPTSPVTSSPATTSNNPSVTQPTPVTYVKVTLEVNGSMKGTVQVAKTSNQCDVLSQALADGYLQSLDMQYNAAYQSQGVYRIDGQGSLSSVWWVYTVNGTSPPYGCSQMSVHDADTVNWKYLRS